MNPKTRCSVALDQADSPILRNRAWNRTTLVKPLPSATLRSSQFETDFSVRTARSSDSNKGSIRLWRKYMFISSTGSLSLRFAKTASVSPVSNASWVASTCDSIAFGDAPLGRAPLADALRIS